MATLDSLSEAEKTKFGTALFDYVEGQAERKFQGDSRVAAMYTWVVSIIANNFINFGAPWEILSAQYVSGMDAAQLHTLSEFLHEKEDSIRVNGVILELPFQEVSDIVKGITGTPTVSTDYYAFDPNKGKRVKTRTIEVPLMTQESVMASYSKYEASLEQLKFDLQNGRIKHGTRVAVYSLNSTNTVKTRDGATIPAYSVPSAEFSRLAQSVGLSVVGAEMASNSRSVILRLN